MSDIAGFLPDQGAEKPGDGGEQEAQKEESEEAGDLGGSQEKHVSVCFFLPSFHWTRFCLTSVYEAPVGCQESFWAQDRELGF